MSENVPPEVDKNRRSRSFGSFLLVLLVLLVVLLIVGGEKLTNPETLTQDLYEWHLNRGDVVSQQFRGTDQGTNQIMGVYRKDGPEGPVLVPFRVHYASLENREERFKELKAISDYRPLPGRAFTEGVRRKLIQPLEVRHLWATRPDPVPASASPDEAPEPRTVEEEVVLVQAIVQGRALADDSVSGLDLPDRSRSVNFEIQLDRGDDLAGLLALAEEAGARMVTREFDLDPTKGTSWKDNNSLFGNFLIYMAPWVLLFIIFMVFMRQMRAQGGAGGVMSFGRSRAQLYSKENLTNVTFDDVAGAEEAKAEVREIVEFLKNPTRFTRIGGRIPRGVLLVGSPGCGKTLLAKAIAGEAEVPFFSISGSDFVEMFVGVGASRVRDLFKQARESSPCIIFLDEIDAVGRRRGSGMGGGHDEREQTLNAILVEMDGFGTDEGIIVVAATNRPDVLDPALLRPGRFDREVTIDMPDLNGRAQILAVHIKKVKAAKDIDLQVLAKSTPGYSGADLAAIINEAAIMAVLDKREEVSMADLEEARDKVRYGRQKKSRKMEEEDRRITAYHEAGHALVAARIEEVDPPHKVTIVPRGHALGATMVLPEKESYHMQRQKLLGQLAMLFGGRVAEAMFCGDISAGASDDIRRATDLARAMVAELGMSERIGPINYAERQGSDFLGTELMRGKLHSEKTAREIDEEVHRILSEAYQRAEAVLSENAEPLEHLAEGLLTYETITGEEIEQLLAGASISELRPAPPEEPTPSPTSTPGPREDRAPGQDRSGELPGQPGLSPA